jgi:hypothetical protein
MYLLPAAARTTTKWGLAGLGAWRSRAGLDLVGMGHVTSSTTLSALAAGRAITPYRPKPVKPPPPPKRIKPVPVPRHLRGLGRVTTAAASTAAAGRVITSTRPQPVRARGKRPHLPIRRPLRGLYGLGQDDGTDIFSSSYSPLVDVGSPAIDTGSNLPDYALIPSTGAPSLISPTFQTTDMALPATLSTPASLGPYANLPASGGLQPTTYVNPITGAKVTATAPPTLPQATSALAVASGPWLLIGAAGLLLVALSGSGGGRRR